MSIFNLNADHKRLCRQQQTTTKSLKRNNNKNNNVMLVLGIRLAQLLASVPVNHSLFTSTHVFCCSLRCALLLSLLFLPFYAFLEEWLASRHFKSKRSIIVLLLNAMPNIFKTCFFFALFILNVFEYTLP